MRDEVMSKVSTAASTVSYATSGLLISGEMFNFLNVNAAAFGVILGFMTFITQLVFSYLKHRAYVSSVKCNHHHEED